MDFKSLRSDKLKLTQEEFANLYGISIQEVQELDKTGKPDMDLIVKIATKSGLDFNTILSYEKPRVKPISAKDTWEKTNFTKKSLSGYLNSALEQMDIPDDMRKNYIDDLEIGIMSKFVKPTVAIVGRSDTGKSTLINSLIGAEKMPAKWTPTTSTAVYVKHIKDRPAFIHDEAWIFKRECTKYCTSVLTVDEITRRIKSKGIKNKKEDIQQFASQLQDEMQSKCSDLLKERSEQLSVKVKEYVSDYQEGVQASFQEANLNADFDAGYAFASSLAKIGIIGGLGAFLAADAAFAFGSWAFLFGIGGQIALFANFLGPIGIVAGALISAGLGIMKLFGGGWEKSVAKKLVNAYEEKGVTDQYRKAINEYWAQTETAFDQAAEQLDQAWTAYVERLQTTVDSYDIEQIETSLTAAKGIQNFFEHIPL